MERREWNGGNGTAGMKPGRPGLPGEKTLRRPEILTRENKFLRLILPDRQRADRQARPKTRPFIGTGFPNRDIIHQL